MTARRRPRPTTNWQPSRGRDPGANAIRRDERVVVRSLTLDGPVDLRFLGAVVRRSGLVTASQYTPRRSITAATRSLCH
jgi:hypothetical protein